VVPRCTCELNLPERLLAKLDYSPVAFVVSGILLVFVFGVAVGNYHFFPYSAMKQGLDVVQEVFAQRDTILGRRPTEFLEPARYRGQGVTTWKRTEAVAGFTLLTGFFEGSNEMRLIRLDGSIVHRWPVSFRRIFPNPEHIRPRTTIPQSDWNVAAHGSVVLPDGSVVFNFTNKGAAKIDKCGSVVWTVPQMMHHSIERASDGGFWIPNLRYIEQTPAYPHIRVPYYEDTIVRLSENGKILKEISVLEILYKNGLDHFALTGDMTNELTHLNDVEELTPEMAKHFPQFAAHDLLLSTRFKHLVMVVDSDTLGVKWYQSGPWIGQHDPDFLDDGTIILFSNNDDGTTSGSVYGGSTIMKINPADRRVEYRYGIAPGQKFFTRAQGKLQTLGSAEGHILVTEARAGRAFEVDANGNLVWEYHNQYDELNAALLTGAERYAEDYFTQTDWSCP
jgi:hypothetical protein